MSSFDTMDSVSWSIFSPLALTLEALVSESIWPIDSFGIICDGFVDSLLKALSTV